MPTTEGLNSFSIPGVGLTQSGNSPVFFLSPATRVMLASTATGVAAAGSIQLTLQVCVGDPGLAISWLPVVSLGVQSSTGNVNATALTPASVLGSAPMWRIAWVVVGNGASVIATAVGVS